MKHDITQIGNEHQSHFHKRERVREKKEGVREREVKIKERERGAMMAERSRLLLHVTGKCFNKL